MAKFYSVAAVSCVCFIGAAEVPCKAQTLTTLANFNATNGASPQSPLIQGTDGKFYGAASLGGAYGGGSIFVMTPAGALTTLYSFCSGNGCADGSEPAGIIQASDGNFYGTTPYLGANGGGTIFKVRPAGMLTTLHSFCTLPSCADGSVPLYGPIQASDGNLYGTTLIGGVYNNGTAFKVSLSGTLTTLYSFLPTDRQPSSGLVQGFDGNFYGETIGGGSLFRMTPAGTLTILHSFDATGINCPFGGLVQGTDGDFYGTAVPSYKGTGIGTVFKITRLAYSRRCTAFALSLTVLTESVPPAG